MVRDIPETIDRHSYLPAYVQLVNILRDQVANGTYRPGDRLPSESELCARYGVSPMTVRRSINILADQGIVDPVQGLGTFAKPIELSAARFDLKNLERQLSGDQVTVKVLEATIHSANDRVARKLDVEPGARVIYIRRQILQEANPFLYHREYLVYDPTRPLVEAELEVTSLRGLFSGQGSSELKRGNLSIEATVVNETESRLLGVPVGTAAFQLEHIFYDFDDRPVSWGWFICPSTRLSFEASIGVREPAEK